MADILVKKSKIEGKGAFAGRDFKKGEIILRWDTSKTLTKEQADNLPEHEQRYVSFFDGKYILMHEPERYVNHSCDANTYAKDFCDVAKRDIRKGEEITTDYAKEVPGINMKCNCGSKNCRKYIRT
ncbi:SET domain-containing protein-lysine N-methyltransferase [Candidatus Woesearchaeota archaeon]|nr:SET domain-containing protein-lysine N-methyltransferase [Candidatus Woesearchaeota archaeon]